MATEFEIAWAAGFLDADGCFRISKSPQGTLRTRQYQALVTATQVDPTPIFLLKDWFGGHVYTVHRKRPAMDQYVWSATSQIAVKAIRLVLPHLRVKARQAGLLLELHRLMSPKGSTTPAVSEMQRREQLFQTIKELNRVGVPRGPSVVHVHQDLPEFPPQLRLLVDEA